MWCQQSVAPPATIKNPAVFFDDDDDYSRGSFLVLYPENGSSKKTKEQRSG
jgi:hypothetical protein